MRNFDIIPIMGYLGIFLSILLISELAYKWIIKDSEFTRKISHTITGIVALGFPIFFDNYLEVLVLGVFSFLLLFISKRAGIFHSIHRLDRSSHGAVLLPLAIFLCYLAGDSFNSPAYFFIPVLILSVSDPAAGLIGGRIRSFHWNNMGSTAATKTFLGSLAFFISALLILLFALPRFYDINLINLLIVSVLIALISSLVELVSGKGIDNLTVPMTIFILLFTMDKLI